MYVAPARRVVAPRHPPQAPRRDGRGARHARRHGARPRCCSPRATAWPPRWAPTAPTSRSCPAAGGETLPEADLAAAAQDLLAQQHRGRWRPSCRCACAWRRKAASPDSWLRSSAPGSIASWSRVAHRPAAHPADAAVDGRWPRDAAAEVALGRRLAAAAAVSAIWGAPSLAAERPPRTARLAVVGIARPAAAPRRKQAFAPLAVVQRLAGQPRRFTPRRGLRPDQPGER